MISSLPCEGFATLEQFDSIEAAEVAAAALIVASGGPNKLGILQLVADVIVSTTVETIA